MWINKAQYEEITGKKGDSPRFYINCGGHALHVNQWYQIGDDPHWFIDNQSRCRRHGGWKHFERTCIKFILKDCPDLKMVDAKAIDDVSINLEKYEIIAFRISRHFFGDFHFMRCERNGDWTEKNGHGCVYRHNYEDIHECWSHLFDNSKEYFFIRKRVSS